MLNFIPMVIILSGDTLKQLRMGTSCHSHYMITISYLQLPRDIVIHIIFVKGCSLARQKFIIFETFLNQRT